MSSVLRIALPVTGLTCGLAVTVIWNASSLLCCLKRFNFSFNRMAGLAMLSAAYYRHRAEVLRFALITTCEPVAARRLRALVEKYWHLADRADKHIEAGPHRAGTCAKPPISGDACQ